MNFQERLNEAIRQEKERQKREADREHEFRQAWERLRGGQGDLWTALAEGASVMQEAPLRWHANARPNNGGVELVADPVDREGEPTFRLSFDPVYREQKVLCRTTPSDLLDEERSSLDELGSEAIRSKIETFVVEAMRRRFGR